MRDNQTDLFNTPLDPSILDHTDHLPDESHCWPSVLMELMGVIQNRLTQRGIDMPELPLEVVLDIGEYMGGSQVYLPKGDRLRQHVRDMQIWNEFNGRNIKTLARKHHVTDKTIYEICARMRKIEQAKRQPDLFG